MKLLKILPVLLVFPVVAFGAGRGDASARVGIAAGRNSQAGLRASTVVNNVVNDAESPKIVGGLVVEEKQENTKDTADTTSDADDKKSAKAADSSSSCRDAYRECMDNFCLLDESQGERCACSDNINRAKNKIKEVLEIQAEADKLFTICDKRAASRARLRTSKGATT